MLSNRQTDTHTYTDPTTVTLAAHARRWLISYIYLYIILAVVAMKVGTYVQGYINNTP